MTFKKIHQLLNERPQLNSLPIIANVDFGHTSPMITFPIGGRVKIRANKIGSEIVLIR